MIFGSDVAIGFGIPAGKTQGTFSVFAQDGTAATPDNTNYTIEYSQDVSPVKPGFTTYYLVADGVSEITEITNVKIGGANVASSLPVKGDGSKKLKFVPGVSYSLTVNIEKNTIESVTIGLGGRG